MPIFARFPPLLLEPISPQEVLIVATALVASVLTLISGFGLGTLLLPVFALFFPLELAVAMTAVVHVMNNLFKFGLLWRSIDTRIVMLFGLPGILGAWSGSLLLNKLEAASDLYPGIHHPVSVTAVVIGVMMAVFAILELLPAASKWSLPSRYLLPGGLLSGFFGGLSGHQGALRSIFLLRTGLGKEAFIGTGIAIALLVDLTRIPIYLHQLPPYLLLPQWPLLVSTTLAAFAGAWFGKRWIPKITVRSIQRLVAVWMLLIASALIAGLI